MEIVGYLLTGGAAAGIWKVIDTIVAYIIAKKNKNAETVDDKIKKVEQNQEKLEENQKVCNEAQLALLHDRLYQGCNHYMKQGWCSIADKKNLEYMFEPYKKLGGNGTAEMMYTQCQKLPIQKLEDKI